MFRRFPLLFLAAMLIVGSFSVSGCATQTNDTVGLTLASMETMPAPVQRQPRRVSQAYQFAAANADILQYMPCYRCPGKFCPSREKPSKIVQVASWSQ